MRILNMCSSGTMRQGLTHHFKCTPDHPTEHVAVFEFTAAFRKLHKVCEGVVFQDLCRRHTRSMTRCHFWIPACLLLHQILEIKVAGPDAAR